MVRGDSERVDPGGGFDLIVTCPPFFSPERRRQRHGLQAPACTASGYGSWVAKILSRMSRGLTGANVVCVVKTDVWFRGRLLPVGFEIAAAMQAAGLPLRAHWVWQRLASFSPCAPSFSNVLVFSRGPFARPSVSGLFTDLAGRRRDGLPGGFCPEIFRPLIELLGGRGCRVLDPFAGLGAVVSAADSVGGVAVGIEKSKRQFERARETLAGIDRVRFLTPRGSAFDGATGLAGPA